MIEKGSFNSTTFVNEKVLKFNKIFIAFSSTMNFICDCGMWIKKEFREQME